MELIFGLLMKINFPVSLCNIFLIIIAILATSISSLGSATLTGLYIIVLLTVGSYLRSFLVPTVTDVIYSTLPDPQPLRELISGLYITRNIRYE